MDEIDSIARVGRRTVEPADLVPETPYIGLEHMPRGSITLDTWETAAKVTSTKLHFSVGDVLFGKLRPYFRKVGMAFVDGVCSSDILVLQPEEQSLSSYLLLKLSQQEVIDYANAVSNGARMPRVGWADIAHYPTVLPSCDVLGSFERTVSPLIQQLRANTFESRTLVSLRDTLLPKLLSGEIRAREAEALAGATA